MLNAEVRRLKEAAASVKALLRQDAALTSDDDWENCQHRRRRAVRVRALARTTGRADPFRLPG
jgi:hypothetical protein